MPDDSSMHVFRIQPTPGVADPGQVIVTDNADRTNVVVVLPNSTQIIITADRAVYVRGDQMLTLSQWQWAPISRDDEYSDTAPYQVPAAGYQAPPPEAPEAPRRGGTFTLGGRRTFA